MVATSFVVATAFAQCSFNVDVATSVSCRDIIVFLFFQLLSCDISLSCDHFSVCMMTSCCDFDFLVAIMLVVFLPSYASIVCRDLKVLLQPKFLLLGSSSGRDLNEWSRHHF